MTTITNHAGLLFISKEDADERPLGHLFCFEGHGVFGPTGRVDVDPILVDKHNEMLDQALLDGLDNNCQVGQCGTFYIGKAQNDARVVKTFTGRVVSERTRVNGRSLTFWRKGKRFVGRLSQQCDAFNFRRTA